MKKTRMSSSSWTVGLRTYNVRAATLSDAPEMKCLNEQSMKENYTFAFWRRTLRENHGCSFVVTTASARKIVAYILCRRLDDGAVLHVVSLAVADAERRRGLASHLLKQALAVAAACTVRLETRASNTAAIATYRSNGFYVSDDQTYRYPDGEQGVVMLFARGAT